MTSVTIHSDFVTPKNKICHCFHFIPFYLPWSGGTGAMILIFWMLNLRQLFLSLLSLLSRASLVPLHFLSLEWSVQFSHTVTSDSLWPHELQHTRLSCPSPTPGALSNSCPWSLCCHPTISSSVIPFSSCLQSFPASGSFPLSQFFASSGQSIRVVSSVYLRLLIFLPAILIQLVIHPAQHFSWCYLHIN